VDAADLRACGVPGVVVNTLHLTQSPGVGLIKSQGGVHSFMGWDRPVISDSGGFQAMSMIRENARYGSISDAGISYVNADAPGRKKLKLTPEKCIQIQFDLGSDILVCLDDCPRPDASSGDVAEAVRRTIHWAERCKQEFETQVARRGLDTPPLLFGVIQGGFDRASRQQCAEGLLPLEFDGYGFGGWPLGSEGELAEEILAYTASLMPRELPKYALGVGSPENVARCRRMGYGIFDCVLPTRDARHHRLYCEDPEQPAGYSFLYILDDQHKRDRRPVSERCDCICCVTASKSYLHHLFKIRDSLACRLATIHNLRFYQRWMECIRAEEASAATRALTNGES
jgi:queuine tRNA-ribosyltransferase